MGGKKSDDQFRIAKETFHHKSEPLMRNAHVMSSSQVVENFSMRRKNLLALQMGIRPICGGTKATAMRPYGGD